MTLPDEPIRVLRVIARLNVGGPALHVAYLTRGLAERGYETTLVAGRVGEEEGSMEYAAHEYGVEPLPLPELQRDIAFGRDIAAAVNLRNLIRRLRPHVLHTHTAKAGAVGRFAALLAGDARPPVVVHTFHGHVLRGYFGPGRTAAFRLIEQQLGRGTDALIAVSPEVRDELVALRVASRDRFQVVRLGLDLEQRATAPPGAREEERRRLRLEPGQLAVGWLGRMTEIKRVDDLLRAFALLRQTDPRAQLVLAGDGPLRPRLEQLAEELGVGDAVRFTGMRRDVASLLAALDVVALTSANEGTPVTLIEAIAAGKPVVSTDVGGVGDVVRADETGLLVAPGDPAAFARALHRVGSDERFRDGLPAAAREEVIERYSVPRLVDDVDALYRGLLAEKLRRASAPRRRSVAEPLTPTLPPRALAPAPRRLKILLVSQYFPPEVGATQSRMQAFAEHLARRGHEVTVLAEFPNHPHGVIPGEYRGRLFEDDRTNEYRVIRTWVKASAEKTQATRMAFYLSYMAGAAALAPLAGKVDVVVATTPPLFAASAGLAIARMNRAPFVLDVRDLWPAAAVGLNQIGHGPTLALAEWLERTLYREADAVVAVTHPFCEHIDRLRRKPPRTLLIPNGTLELFFEGNGRRDRLGLPDDRFVATFAGTIGIAQGLSVVLDAAAASDGRTDFALVGDGPMKPALVREAAERRLTNVHFRPQVPLADVPPILAGSDALLVSLSAHPTFVDFVPSKMIDYMAAGRPVVLAAAGESARLLESAGAGIVVPPEDGEALAQALDWLREHPDEMRELGERGRAWARRRLRSVQAERLEAVLLDVTAPREPF